MEVIPDAAVNAALDALPYQAADYVDTDTMRAALEAAEPHMRQAFYLEMNLRAVQDELRATPIYPLGKIEDKR